MAESGILATSVQGSGVRGRITKEDALNAKLKKENESLKEIEKSVTTDSTKKEDDSDRSERRQKMSPLRKTVAKRLVSVKNETAMLTTFNEVNMQPIMELRKNTKNRLKQNMRLVLVLCLFSRKLAVWL